MEMNRDNAEDAVRLARDRFRKEEFAAALRLFTKAQNMYPTSETQSWIDKTEAAIRLQEQKQRQQQHQQQHQQQQHTRASTKNAPSATERTAPTDTRAYTPKQKQEVDRILGIVKENKRFMYYTIMGVEKDASKKDIDKAYKKVQPISQHWMISAVSHRHSLTHSLTH
jgi:G3E family GTPase